MHFLRKSHVEVWYLNRINRHLSVGSSISIKTFEISSKGFSKVEVSLNCPVFFTIYFACPFSPWNANNKIYHMWSSEKIDLAFNWIFGAHKMTTKFGFLNELLRSLNTTRFVDFEAIQSHLRRVFFTNFGGIFYDSNLWLIGKHMHGF